MKSTLIQKIRARDGRIKYPKSICTLELSRTEKGSLMIRFNHERYPDHGMVFQTFKTAFWVDADVIKLLKPAEIFRLEGVL